MVKKVGPPEKPWCIIHAHPRKKGSKTDKPPGSIIKCFATKKEADKMHQAILISQQKRKSIQAEFSLVCFSHKFSESEILAMIPDDIIKQIKEKDPRPYFRAYVLAHTGTSTPKIVGQSGGMEIIWTKKAIQSMKDLIKRGIKFFKGHNSDSSHSGRESIGEVIASNEMEINGKLSNIVIGYFPPQTREEVKNYNVNSMEAVWNLVKSKGKICADKMLKLTGIALGNDKYERPAFEGASVVGAVQAFENTNIKENESDMENITFSDVKKAIQDMNIFPSQVFDSDRIRQDNTVKDLLKEKDQKISELTISLDEKTKESETLSNKCNELQNGQLKLTAKERYEKLLNGDDKKLTDKQKEFLLKQIDRISDFSDDGIKKHFDSSLELFDSVVAPLIKDTVDVKTVDPGNGSIDYSKPENNPFIPKED